MSLDLEPQFICSDIDIIISVFVLKDRSEGGREGMAIEREGERQIDREREREAGREGRGKEMTTGREVGV